MVITDQWTCDFTTAEQFLYDEIMPVATVIKAIDCNAVNPGGEITVTQTGGSGNFVYDVAFPDGSTPQPSNTTGVFAALADVGVYTFTITDQAAGHACVKTVTQELFPRVEPVIQIGAFKNVTCIGDNDGTFTVRAADNGISPYTFEITAATGGSLTLPYAPSATTGLSATFTGLEGSATGITYTIAATGDNNCTTDITQIITEPDAIVVDAPTVVQFGCASGNNPNNASIEITGANGGSNTFVRYEFINTDDPTTGAVGDAITVQDGPNSTYIETNVIGGTYTINVYDDKGCVGTQTATIDSYDELLTATAATTNPISCNPGNDGEITVTVTSTDNDGTKFEYSINNGTAYQTSNVFPNLGIGTHNFLIRHVDTGCIITASERIADPNTFTIDLDKISDVTCFGTATGEITLALVDATYPGGFDWEIFDTNGTPANTADDTSVDNGTEATNGPTAGINLPAGAYYVTISQNNLPTCGNTENFTISGPTATITGDTHKTDVTCVLNDGSIEVVDVLGGWGGYTYFVDIATNPAPTDASGFQSNPLFGNLSGAAAGTDYQVWIADSKGCLEQLPNVNLIDPSAISADLQVNVENCTNFEGEIVVINEAGGQGSNYRYQLQVFNTATSAFENLRPIQTADVFSGLGAGRYQVLVSDQWSCSNATSTSIELYVEIMPLATVVKTIDCTVDSGGQITISQTGGSPGTFTYTVEFPDGSTPQSSSTNGIFTDLTQVGEYTFTVTDDRSCTKTIKKFLQPQVDPVLSVDSFTDVVCFGNADGTISVSVLDNGVGPYIFQITDMDGTGVAIDPTSATDTTAEFSGLANTTTASGYTITATGANGCPATITKTIAQPAAAVNVPAPATVAFDCSTGNVTDYPTIDILGVNGGSGVYVRYEFINNDNPATVAVGDAITVQDGANPSYTETNLTGGNYTINVYDDKGCMNSTTTSIAPFVGIRDAVITVDQNVSCATFDENITVSVTVNPATASPNLEYDVSGMNVTYTQTNATGIFTGLGVGNYAVSITNMDTGCTIITTHTVVDPDIMLVSAVKQSDEECLNDATAGGSFEVTIDRYTGAYDYQVFDSNDNPVSAMITGNTAATFTVIDLVEGSYYVTIIQTDAPECIKKSNRVAILAPTVPITIALSEQASPSCTNDQGVILVDPAGGYGPYTIELNNTTTSQVYTETNVEAFVFRGLSGGDYTVTVTDTKNCIETSTITLVRPDDIVPTIDSTPLTCFDGNTASVTASINTRNVSPVYQYRLNRHDDSVGTNLLQTSSPQASDTFGGLSASFYSITITDDVGCSEETAIIEIDNPSEVVAELTRTSPLTCTTGVELELSATGGLSGSYEYRRAGTSIWTAMGGNSVSLPTTGVFDAGVYRYEVRDAVNTCAAVLSDEIEEDIVKPLTLSVDKSAAVINCNGDNAAIIFADAEGGLGNYEYSLYTDASLSTASLVAGPQDDGEFDGLPMGTYYVNVTSEDCTAPAEQVIITEPDPLSVVNPNDFTNVSCNGASDGTITVALTGGVGPYQYAISPNLNRFDDENTFENLAPGNYRVIAQDRNGCFVELEYTIIEPGVLEVSATALPEVCEGEENGSIELMISGGTAPYSTRLSSETNFIQNRNILNNLASGDYIVFIQDAVGCEETVIVTVDPGVNLNASVEPIYGCENNIPSNYINIVLDDASLADDVLYALDSENTDDMQLNPFFRNIAPGTHYIAISHANGCIVTHSFEIENYAPLTIAVEQSNINELTATVNGGKEDYTIYFGDKNNGPDNTFMINRTDTYVVTVVDENGCEATANIFIEFIDIEIPNFFSPNGDAENQYWKPRNDEGFPQILTIIFDRYGREVYRMRQGDRGWDGFYQQTELPTGDYWYIIKLNGENDNREFVGHFTLYR
ncbi:T9SS type B sorting domain-containing protein [Pricia sp.]|uniref:T9SS type B sorting domain-containing protein n=1 Tax=Pricia sp. TaxID=2268138 RepID=UPI003593EF2C